MILETRNSKLGHLLSLRRMIQFPGSGFQFLQVKTRKRVSVLHTELPRKNYIEPVSKRSILFKVKEGENFNLRRHEVSALVNILNISRIKI
jgi:hypothetical protein